MPYYLLYCSAADSVADSNSDSDRVFIGVLKSRKDLYARKRAFMSLYTKDFLHDLKSDKSISHDFIQKLDKLYLDMIKRRKGAFKMVENMVDIKFSTIEKSSLNRDDLKILKKEIVVMGENNIALQDLTKLRLINKHH